MMVDMTGLFAAITSVIAILSGIVAVIGAICVPSHLVLERSPMKVSYVIMVLGGFLSALFFGLLAATLGQQSC